MDFPTNRLEALTDGIFAIAMTILVVSLDIPHLSGGAANGDVSFFLFGQAHKILNYFLSFVLLAVFWIQHHEQSHVTDRTDNSHLWINMFLLMFISLIPFTTSLISTFTFDRLDEGIFGFNILLIGILFYANLYYAGTRDCISKNCKDQPTLMQSLKAKAIITPAVAIAGIIFALFTPYYSPFVYLLIPIFMVIKSGKKRSQ